MPTYLDENGNPKSAGKVYLDSRGDPIGAEKPNTPKRMELASAPSYSSPTLGALKGAASTVFGLGGLASKLPVLGPWGGQRISDLTTAMGAAPEYARFEHQPDAIRPKGVGEHLGFGAERIGEFFLPGGNVNRGVGLVKGAVESAPAIIQKVAPWLTRAALEGTSAGAVAAAQGGDPVTTGTFAGLGSAVLGPVGGALEKYAPTVVNRFLRPTLKARERGANPGQTAVEEGVIAPTIEALKSTVKKTRETMQGELGKVLQAHDGMKITPGAALVETLDASIADARRAGDKALVKRLADIKAARLGDLAERSGGTGQLTPLEVTKFKNDIGGGINWKTTDELQRSLNSSLKRVYDALDSLVDETVPASKAINERLSRLHTLEQQIAKRSAMDPRSPSMFEPRFWLSLAGLLDTAPGSTTAGQVLRGLGSQTARTVVPKGLGAAASAATRE
jgi:hypothetical protein